LAEALKVQLAARACHETFNERTKHQVLGHPGKALPPQHHCAWDIAFTVITQFSIANGEPPFDVEYGNQ
jgi:hypothetical protein